MNKPALLRVIIAELEADLRRQQAANQQASAGATDGEARAETKWDTCGLESSYLARGHALQFKALASDLEDLRTFMIPVFSGLPVGIGALIETELDKEKMICFLLPCAGGTEVSFEGQNVSVITPASPIGAALMDKKQGDRFSFRAGSIGKILSVL
ncbi:MAG: GreA/GreB family elongation factor [Verrucomicrobia bacterium]|nr:GreA/GreB family elongation factor [Verrucomicrobiota bacterium]